MKRKKEILQLDSNIKRLPPRGFHPGNRTGNAAGAHKIHKGRGYKYDRNYEKRKENQEID